MKDNKFTQLDVEVAKSHWDDITVPEYGVEEMERRIMQAKMEKKRQSRNWTKAVAGIAAAFAVCFISVNVNGTAAKAMGELPGVGGFFKVITVRHYEWMSEDEKTEIQANIPAVEDDANTSDAEELNDEMKQYIEGLVAEFKEENADNYAALDVNYRVISGTEEYLTVDICGVETEASGYEFHKYYTIDKKTCKELKLSQLFADETDYVTPITEEIKTQMRADKDTPYFIAEDGEEDGFEKIAEDQNFYIDENGDLVIAFDEYEVGPGSIGAPTFVISKSVVENIKAN